MDAGSEYRNFNYGLVTSNKMTQGGNFWQWAKIVDAGCEKGFEDKTCMAYHKDRIAVSFPKTGVKVWMWLKGGNLCIPHLCFDFNRI